MLVSTPITNMNNVFNVMAQGYNDYNIYGDSYSSYLIVIRNMSVEQVQFEGFFVSL